MSTFAVGLAYEPFDSVHFYYYSTKRWGQHLQIVVPCWPTVINVHLAALLADEPFDSIHLLVLFHVSEFSKNNSNESLLNYLYPIDDSFISNICLYK